MMNLHSRTVNVDRNELLKALKKNQETHRAEFNKALIAFKTRLLTDLAEALAKVQESTPEDLKGMKIDLDFPQNHVQEYQDVIDMLELSTDAVINIDSESFKAYFKNEWSWSERFATSISNYAVGSFIKGKF